MDLKQLRSALRCCAVTGTNGKTTTTAMLASIVGAAGGVRAEVTTLGARVGDGRLDYDGSMSSFSRVAREAVDRGATTLALETTSRALAAGFAERWPPDVAVFTNLTRDHLDRHGSPEAYLAAKARLFLALPVDGVAVLNRGDPASELIAQALGDDRRLRGFTLGPPRPQCEAIPSTLATTAVEVQRDGTRIHLAPGPLAERLGGSLTLQVVGRAHAANALAAAVAAEALELPPDAIPKGLQEFPGIAGRFELVAERPVVAIDYAHTPHALATTLRTARLLADAEGGRVICVFGCGGRRDRGKRAEMGRVADDSADRVWLTTDNPRSEDPAAIAATVRSGARGRARWREQPDRARAIQQALEGAAPADVVVVAGKGHERRQERADGAIELDDWEVAAACCRALGLAIRGRVAHGPPAH